MWIEYGLNEFVGTALLVAVVVGSGIMGVQLMPGDVGLQWLENSLIFYPGTLVHR